MNDEENTEKKKRARKIVNRAAKELRFGKINVNKYFSNEVVRKDENSEQIYPNYNNIVVKRHLGTGNKSKFTPGPIYKICNVCYGFANYTCPRCSDKYCSKECFKTHKEIKCVQYLEL